jgi:hypothetical protein
LQSAGENGFSGRCRQGQQDIAGQQRFALGEEMNTAQSLGQGVTGEQKAGRLAGRDKMPGGSALQATELAVAALAGRVSRPQHVEQLRPKQGRQREQHDCPLRRRQCVIAQKFGVGRRAVVEFRRRPVPGKAGLAGFSAK